LSPRFKSLNFIRVLERVFIY